MERVGIKNHIYADIWLLILTIIWGTSFSLVKTALQDISPILFLSIRFWLATLILLPLFLIRQERSITFNMVKKGVVLGFFMFLGMILQTVGLKYTTASKSGFLTGLAVIFVPMLVIFFEKKFPRIESMIGVFFAVTGIYLLTGPQGGGFNKGDLLTLFCAVSFAFQIVFIEMLVRRGESFLLAFLMILFTALVATFSTLLLEESFIHVTYRMLKGLFIVSVFSTAVGFWIQTHWQPKTSATAAAVILTMEPVFAAFFAMLLIGEQMTGTGWIGAGLILCGMLVAEFRR